MNLGWNHILLACLLTVLEIYGTEAILSIPYSISDSDMTAALRTCFDGSTVNIGTDFYENPPIIYFVKRQTTQKSKILFVVQRLDREVCFVYYDSSQMTHLYITERRSEILLAAKRPSAYSEDNGEVEFVLQMDNVRQVINGIKSENPLEVSFDNSFDNSYLVLYSSALDVKLTYQVGTFPTKPGRLGNRLNGMWHFTPISVIKTIEFTCGPSIPVEFHCNNEECTQIEFSVNKSFQDILAYIVQNKNNKLRLVKGNQKGSPKETLCELYVRNDHKMQFPFGIKNHVNVARLTNEVRSGKGFRVFMNSLRRT